MLSKSTSSKARREIASRQYKSWLGYQRVRREGLPEDFHLTEKMQYQMKQIWDLVDDRKTRLLEPAKVLQFHFEYMRKYKFDIPLEAKCILQLVHPHQGYLSHLPVCRSFDHESLGSIVDRAAGRDLPEQPGGQL